MIERFVVHKFYAKFSERIKTILLLDDGEKYSWTKARSGNYRKRYVEGGILGLVEDIHTGKRCHLSDKEKEQLSNYLQKTLHGH